MPSHLVIDPQYKVEVLRQTIEGSWPTPTAMDSWVFLVTETAEVGDCLIRLGFGANDYSRNNHRKVDVDDEIGDVMLMLCTLATALDIDVNEALDKSIKKIMVKHAKT